MCFFSSPADIAWKTQSVQATAFDAIQNCLSSKWTCEREYNLHHYKQLLHLQNCQIQTISWLCSGSGSENHPKQHCNGSFLKFNFCRRLSDRVCLNKMMSCVWVPKRNTRSKLTWLTLHWVSWLRGGEVPGCQNTPDTELLTPGHHQPRYYSLLAIRRIKYHLCKSATYVVYLMVI